MNGVAQRVLCVFVLLLLGVHRCGAQDAAESKVKLRFDEKGQFKIVQFTDLHLKDGQAEDRKTLTLMGRILDVEKPQFVVLTGDVLASCRQPDEVLRLCARPMAQRGVYWAYAIGNHDDEGPKDRRSLMDIATSLPYSLSRHGPRDIHGVSNYCLPVHARKGEAKKWILYLIDSNAYPKDEKQGKYDWIHTDQVGWYHRTSRALAEGHGGSVYPALAFFHIPLPEYEQIMTDGQANVAGYRYEAVCCPRINSGFFAAMLERGDVKGTFVGHDHVNDYEGSLHGIRLIYGRATGFNAYGREGFPRGGRVIVLEEDKETFTTWLRLEQGVKVQY